VAATRKTTPGFRSYEKKAVVLGGGDPHRHRLDDAILIKDNHLAGAPAGTLAELVASLVDPANPASASEAAPMLVNDPLAAPKFIEVEVDTFEQFTELCKVPGIDIILLDNFSVDQLRAAVEFRNAMSLRGKLALEASGGVTLDNIAEIAATGVDRIAVGALTHSAPALDIGLDL
jgi:nicotinate-nucleotide pyrophosphorylase (carboxylating)